MSKKDLKCIRKYGGVLYSCSSTRAVHIDVAVNYDTGSVLHTTRRLQSLRGNVKKIISDPGSQLVAASKELKEWRRGWSTAELVEFGNKHGIDWQFIPGNSQHENGGAEIMVKLSKGVMSALMQELGAHILTLNELNTVVLEVTNIVNSRPIGIKPNLDTDSQFLCPNSLLLGRNSDTIAAGPFESKDKFDKGAKFDKERFLLVQMIVNQFWDVWMKNYFPTLLVRRKWHYRQRNMKIGDICFLQDSNQVRGLFRRCRVSNVFPDANGVVRNVEVLAASQQDGTPKYHPQALSRLRRHVNNLILIQPVDDWDKVDDETVTTKSNDNLASTNTLSNFRNLDEVAPETAKLSDADEFSPAFPSQAKGACQVPAWTVQTYPTWSSGVNGPSPVKDDVLCDGPEVPQDFKGECDHSSVSAL